MESIIGGAFTTADRQLHERGMVRVEDLVREPIAQSGELRGVNDGDRAASDLMAGMGLLIAGPVEAGP